MNNALWLEQELPQEFREKFSATPPRIDFGQTVSEDLLWQTAIEWVDSHRAVILKAGAPILQAQLMERDDLLQTAHIVAVEQCRRVLKEGKLEDFVPLFFGHLRGTCLSVWQRHHHEVLTDLDWDNLPDPNPVDITQVCDGIDPRAERESALIESLEFMTDRQREVMVALLGMEEGRGRLGIREAAVWFEMDPANISHLVESACARVSRLKCKKRGGASAYDLGSKSLEKRIAQLEALNDTLLKKNMTLRRQLGRP